MAKQFERKTRLNEGNTLWHASQVQCGYMDMIYLDESREIMQITYHSQVILSVNKLVKSETKSKRTHKYAKSVG